MPRVDREKLRRKLRSALRAAGALVAGEAKREMLRVNTGTLRNAIGYVDAPDGSLAVLIGVDGRIAPHGRHLELGFRPHWVPFRAGGPGLQAWARRVAPQWLDAGGVFVGGPGSRLKSAPGGATGLLGRRLATWATQGGTSPHLPSGSVGWPFLRPALERVRGQQLIAAMRRAWDAA